jgi:hypothetical protein
MCAAFKFKMMPPWTSVALVAVVGFLPMACAESAAGPGGSASAAADVPAAGAPPPVASSRNANLAGGRCHGGTCTCRNRHGSPAEDPGPDEGHKRFEIRLAGQDGSASLQSPTLGELTAGSSEACFYIDVVPGTVHDVTFTAREAQREGGVGPALDIAEYGPKGPWWYEILEVHCAGPGGKCNRDGAEAWRADFRQRKRGRMDPCGSTVISRLTWETSGGTGARELGIFKDFTVKFTMDVKKFPTQFAPGSTECVPK